MQVPRAGVSRAVDTSVHQGTRGNWLPGPGRSVSYRRGGIWWRDAVSLKKPCKKGDEGINTSPPCPPSPVSHLCLLLATPPRRQRGRLLMTSSQGSLRGRQDGGDGQRGTGRRPRPPSTFHFLGALPVLGFLAFSGTQTIWSLFTPCNISRNFKYRHLHLLTDHSRNNNQ